METTKARPQAVAIIGWLYILVGLFMLITGAVAVASSVVVQSASESGMPEALQGAPAMFYVTVVFIQYFGALGFFQITVSVALLVAAVQFMKLRAWARTALEVFSWLSVMFVALVGALWVYSWMKMTSAMPPEMTAPMSPETFTTFGAALWAGLALVIIAAFAVMIKFLRGEAVREAVS